MRSIERGVAKAERERAGRRGAGGGTPGRGPAADLSKLSAYLVTAREPHSLAAEQFKRLRTHVLRRLKARMGKTILVTSAIGGEGKTTTALNLAVAIAQGVNENVLMIDTDLRKPGVHTHLGIAAERGIVDHLRDGVPLEELLVKTGIPKLTLLPSGTPPDNPAELLDSRPMGRLLQEVKGRYPDRYVVLDTSPVNVFTDTAILAPMADGIVLVVRDGSTPREYVLRAIAQLDRSSILGICLNMISAPESLQDSYYYYYDYNRSEPYGRSRS